MARNARDLLRGLFGLDFDTNLNPSGKTISGAASKIVIANPKRINLKICNVIGWAFTLGFDSSLLYYQGIPVMPGQVFELDWKDDFDLVTREIWAVSQGVSNGLSSLAFAQIFETVVIGSES